MPLNGNAGPLNGNAGPLDTDGGAGSFGAAVAGAIAFTIGDFVTSISASIAGGPSTHIVTATAGAHGSISPSGSVTVNDGDQTAFTFTANTGYHVSNVTVNGSSLGALASYTFPPILTDQLIDVQFAINTYTITVSAGANGTISPATNQAVNHGDSVVFTVAANTGYHISDIKVGGVSVGTASPVTVGPVTADTSIQATFAINSVTFNVFAAPHAGGNMSPAGTIPVASGGTQSFTITADPGYHIAAIVIDGINVGTTSPRSVGPVTHESTIDAYFESDNPSGTGAGDDGHRAPVITVDGQDLVLGKDGVYRERSKGKKKKQAPKPGQAQNLMAEFHAPKHADEVKRPDDAVRKALDAAKIQDAMLARWQSKQPK